MQPFWLSISALILPAALYAAMPTQLTLSTSVGRDVDNDQITATFYQQKDAAQPRHLAKELNQIANKSLALGKAYPEVRLSNGNYTTWPNYEQNGKLRNWQGRIEIRLQSRDFTQAAELIAQLQQVLLLQGIQFSVSDDKRLKTQQEMIPEAITYIKTQANIAAKSLGKQVFNITELNVGNSRLNDRSIPRIMQGLAMPTAEDNIRPNLQPGHSELNLQMDAKIELK